MKLKLEPARIRALVTTESYNETDHTIEVVFATEAEVVRRLWDGSKVIEILECNAKSVKLDRLNAGANLVDSHYTGTVRNVIGKVEKAWIDNNECKALIRLSKREDIAGVVADIVSGIISNISVGYNVEEYTETDKPENETPIYRATLWEPLELSVVCIPADYTSGTRNQQDQTFNEVQIISKRKMEDTTTKETQQQQQQAQQQTVDTEAIRREAQEAERTRIDDINEAARITGLEDGDFVRSLVTSNITADEARKKIIDKLVEGQQGQDIRNHTTTKVTGNDETVQFRAAVEETILHRSDSAKFELKNEKAKEMRHASLIDLAIASLRQRGEKVSTLSYSKDEIVKRAMSTSDFPQILSNAVNKSLRAYYGEAPSNWKKFSRKRNANDFKDMYTLQMGGSMVLEEIKEGGEYKNDVMKESGDKFRLKTYGKKISITRQTIINDDLNAFMRKTEMFGRGAAQTEAQIVWDLITQNNGVGRTLADGKALFHSGHGNMGVAASMGVDSFTTARNAMKRQKGLKGEPIDVNPKFLVVPTELAISAAQIINGTIVPNTVGNVNPFKGAFEIIEDVYLTDPKAWYIFADPAMCDVVEYGYLNGQEGLYTEQNLNFDTDNLDIKVRDDFAAIIAEHRGVYRNPGL